MHHQDPHPDHRQQVLLQPIRLRQLLLHQRIADAAVVAVVVAAVLAAANRQSLKLLPPLQ